MKKIISFLVLLFCSFFIFNNSFAWSFDYSTTEVKVDCGWGECNLEKWVDLVRWELDGIEKDKSFSEYIQDVTLYVISFVSFIALLYIVYSGFTIIFSGWDDEKLKNAKKTILHVVIWIALIWMAYPITIFIIRIFQ